MAPGGRGALEIAAQRNFRDLRSDVTLDTRHIEVALRRLRAFVREGALDELDVETTIDRTARNAGELEISLRPLSFSLATTGLISPLASCCSLTARRRRSR